MSISEHLHEPQGLAVLTRCVRATYWRCDKNIYKLETLQSSASERQRYMPKAAAIHYLNVCQGHKSRSRSPEVTVDAVPPLDLTSYQI